MGSSVSCRKNNTKLSVQSNAVCISLSSTLFVIGPENSRHSFNQSNLRVKSIALESPAFSRAWRRLHVLALNLSFAQVGHCDYFGFGFMTLKRGAFISALETRWNYISIFKGSASNGWLSNFFFHFSVIFTHPGENMRDLMRETRWGRGGGGVSILSSFMPHKLR